MTNAEKGVESPILKQRLPMQDARGHVRPERLGIHRFSRTLRLSHLKGGEKVRLLHTLAHSRRLPCVSCELFPSFLISISVIHHRFYAGRYSIKNSLECKHCHSIPLASLVSNAPCLHTDILTIIVLKSYLSPLLVHSSRLSNGVRSCYNLPSFWLDRSFVFSRHDYLISFGSHRSPRIVWDYGLK